MASAIPFDDDLPFEEKVKCLADEELLEIWAESQEMESYMGRHVPSDLLIAPSYEQAIIHELTIRLGRRVAASCQP